MTRNKREEQRLFFSRSTVVSASSRSMLSDITIEKRRLRVLMLNKTFTGAWLNTGWGTIVRLTTGRRARSGLYTVVFVRSTRRIFGTGNTVTRFGQGTTPDAIRRRTIHMIPTPGLSKSNDRWKTTTRTCFVLTCIEERSSWQITNRSVDWLMSSCSREMKWLEWEDHCESDRTNS